MLTNESLVCYIRYIPYHKHCNLYLVLEIVDNHYLFKFQTSNNHFFIHIIVLVGFIIEYVIVLLLCYYCIIIVYIVITYMADCLYE